MRRFLALVTLLVGLVLVGAPAASAHDALESTSPADGVTLDRLPHQVTLTFAEQPLPLGLQVLVKGPTGDVAQGPATISGPVVTQQLSPQAPAGAYVVTYRVTSSDGHPISGTFGFHAIVGLDGSTATATATATAPQGAAAARQGQDTPGQSAAETPSFVPVMLTIAGAVIILAMIAVIWLLSRRRTATLTDTDARDAPSAAGPGRPTGPGGPASSG